MKHFTVLPVAGALALASGALQAQRPFEPDRAMVPDLDRIPGDVDFEHLPLLIRSYTRTIAQL